MCARSESGKRLETVVASLSAAVDRLQADPSTLPRRLAAPMPARPKKEAAA